VRYTGTGCAFEVAKRPLLKLWLYWGIDRSLEIDFVTLSRNDPERWDAAAIVGLDQELAEIGVALPDRGKSGWKHPKGPLESLADEGVRKQFEKAMERVLDTLVD